MPDPLYIARSRGGSNDGQYELADVNENGDVLIAHGFPRYTDIVRKGARWSVQTATAFAPGVALPTTVAVLELANKSLTKSMILDRVWAWQLLGTAAVQGYAIWAQVGATVLSANTALVIYSSNGKASYASAAGTEIQTAINQTVAASGWELVASAYGTLNAATPMGGFAGEMEGRLIVPPGKSLHLMVEGSLATASSWHCGAAVIMATITNE